MTGCLLRQSPVAPASPTDGFDCAIWFSAVPLDIGLAPQGLGGVRARMISVAATPEFSSTDLRLR